MLFHVIYLIFVCSSLNALAKHSRRNYTWDWDGDVQCNRTYNVTWMEIICSNELLLNNIEIDDLHPAVLASIESLIVKGTGDIEGPLTRIPSNVCHFINLRHLSLSFHKIHNIDFQFTNFCLSELRSLDLSKNLISDISVEWFKQISLIEYVDLSSNHLSDLPYDIFNNLSNLRMLNIARNDLTTIELWTIKIRQQVNYESNIINRFSNKYNVDLSYLQIEQIPTFVIDENSPLYFDDTIFAMYNRCAEVHNIPNLFKTYIPTLTLTVLSIINRTNYGQSFYNNCSCDRYYFYLVAFAIGQYDRYNYSFEKWLCPDYLIVFVQRCNYSSSARFPDVRPRLCKVKDSEPGLVPIYTTDGEPSTTTIQPITSTTPSNFPTNLIDIEKYLTNITVLNNFTINNFTSLINSINIERNVTEETKEICQNIIHHIENLINTVNSTLNNSDATVALVSTTKVDPVYRLTQFISSNSSIIYSSQSDYNQSMTSISIDETYINQLADDHFYSFFFLPSLLFSYAQIDSHIEIRSPIVGAHLPIEQSPNVQMSFHDKNSTRSSGRYSCAFWQINQWNNTGCNYSFNSITNRHSCYCNHLTSFALIFTPDGILHETFLPTIITSSFSIISLCISIILSIYQQTKSQIFHRSRRFSITNIFSLSSTLILFILFTVLLIINYQSSTIKSTVITSCQSSKLNLVLTIYFFLILTFITKTLVGIYYYFTTFIHIKVHLFNNQPNKWYFLSLVLTILIALIPTIVASSLSHQRTDVIISKNNICWFHKNYLIQFLIIPVSIFISMNLIIVILISIRLFQFICNTNVNQGKEKRLIVAACVWIASCVLLGILWIVGPLLNLFVNENGESTSMASRGFQWIFALLAGLEGVWILIVNIIFYIRQRSKNQHRHMFSSNNQRKWYRTDNFGRVSLETYDSPSLNNDFS